MKATFRAALLGIAVAIFAETSALAVTEHVIIYVKHAGADVEKQEADKSIIDAFKKVVSKLNEAAPSGTVFRLRVVDRLIVPRHETR